MTLRALAASPLGLLIGLSLGMVGAGGSLLTVPALVYVAGVHPSEATGVSLAVVGLVAGSAVVNYARRGRVRLAAGAGFAAAGVGGSLAGSALNRGIDADVLLLGFAGLMLAGAWSMFRQRPPGSPEADGEPSSHAANRPAGGYPQRRVKRGAAVLGTGTAVGAITGLFGVGGGFVVVPALMLVLRLPLRDAVGTSLLVIAINSAVGLAARAGTGHLAIEVALPFAVAGIIGAAAGHRIAARLPTNKLSKGFASAVAVLGLWMAGSTLAGMVL